MPGQEVVGSHSDVLGGDRREDVLRHRQINLRKDE